MNGLYILNAGKCSLYQRFVSLLMILAICFSFTACGLGAKEKGKVTIVIENTAEDRIRSLSINFKVGDKSVGYLEAAVGKGENYIGEDVFSFDVTSENVSEEELSDLNVVISLTEARGNYEEVVNLALPSEFGDTYDLQLKYRYGYYTIWNGDTQLTK